MSSITIEIPNGSGDPTMSHADELDIKVTAACNWCFSDPNGIFPLPPDSDALPATGTTLQTGTYGPYTPLPDKSGVIDFNAVDTDKKCKVERPVATLRSITVS